MTTAPVPDDNTPGHHPDTEQDKPARAPRSPARRHRFAFRRGSPIALASLAFGASGATAYVDVDDERLLVRFGPWAMTTPMKNVAGAERTGPYRWWKVAGPPRLSFRDRGLTFATATDVGVCVRFHEPVRGLLRRGPLRHPAVTVTVDDPDDLVRFIEQTRRT